MQSPLGSKFCQSAQEKYNTTDIWNRRQTTLDISHPYLLCHPAIIEVVLLVGIHLHEDSESIQFTEMKNNFIFLKEEI